MADLDKPAPDTLDQGVSNIRETAKWTLGALAAVAAAVIVGLQLTGIGKLDPPRLYFAIGGFVVAIACILVMVGLVTDVLLEGTVTASMLEGVFKANQDLNLDMKLETGGFDSIKAFRDEYAKAVAGFTAEGAKARPDPELLAAFQGDIDAFSKRQTALLATARFLKVRQSFRSKRPWLFVTGAIAAGCITLYAWASNPPAPAVVTGAYRTPAMASLVFSTDVIPQYQGQLGLKCVTAQNPRLQVIVLSFAPNANDVVSVPSATCKAQRFTVSDRVGTLWPTSQATK